MATALAIVVLAARQGASEATPQAAPTPPGSILPASVGVGIPAGHPIKLDFGQPMNSASVGAALQVYPQAPTALSWSADARHLTVAPVGRWEPDERYVLVVPSSAQLANGSVLGAAVRYTFTTATAPSVTAFSIHHFAPGAVPSRVASGLSTRMSTRDAIPSDGPPPPADTADGASATTSIHIEFSGTMDPADVERSFLISPAIPGALSWEGSTMTFTPTTRLVPGTRYSVALIGAHDVDGNRLVGDASFSFTVASRATVARVSPANGTTVASPRTVQVWFSNAVDATATGAAFRLVDTTLKQVVAGTVSWSTDGSSLRFLARTALAKGHHFEIRLLDGARDADGNPLNGAFTFTTTAAAVKAPARPVYRAPSPSGSAQSYALALINASRRAFGFAPLVLDARLTAVASAHAWDQIRYGYFSHFSRDGSSFRDRISAAGISWSHAGENQCEDYGSITHALSWCHSIMMAEPYPGVWNHIANILDPNFTRVGVGIGQGSDGKLVITWDFIG